MFVSATVRVQSGYSQVTVRVQSGLQSGLRKTVISVFIEFKDIKHLSLFNADNAEMLVFPEPDCNPDCTLTVT